MNKIHTLALALVVAGCVPPPQETKAWLIVPGGPQLDSSAIAALAGKTCWGWFDRGNNNDRARGAVFYRFTSAPIVGTHWRKWGQEARLEPRKTDPEGYEFMGDTSPVSISPSGTELTFRGTGGFDWYLHPDGNGTYATRAARYPDPLVAGAPGRLTCYKSS